MTLHKRLIKEPANIEQKVENIKYKKIILKNEKEKITSSNKWL